MEKKENFHIFGMLAARNMKKSGKELKMDMNSMQRIYEVDQKNRLEIQKFYTMEKIRSESLRETEEIKLHYAETRRENRLAQCEEVNISESGELTVHTKNLHIKSQERKICNFSNPCLIEMRSTEGDEGLLALEINISGNIRTAVLLKKKIFQVDYIEEKLGMLGAMFMASSSFRRHCYVRNFVAALLSNGISNIIILPTHIGWNRLPDGEWKFTEREEQTWKECQKLAK